MAQLFVADDLFAWRATVTLVPRVRIQPDIHRGDACIFRDKGAIVFFLKMGQPRPVLHLF